MVQVVWSQHINQLPQPSLATKTAAFTSSEPAASAKPTKIKKQTQKFSDSEKEKNNLMRYASVHLGPLCISGCKPTLSFYIQRQPVSITTAFPRTTLK